MIKFEYQYDSTSPIISVTMLPDMTLDNVLSSFEMFLRASGYVFDGVITTCSDEFVNNDGEGNR